MSCEKTVTPVIRGMARGYLETEIKAKWNVSREYSI